MQDSLSRQHGLAHQIIIFFFLYTKYIHIFLPCYCCEEPTSQLSRQTRRLLLPFISSKINVPKPLDQRTSSPTCVTILVASFVLTQYQSSLFSNYCLFCFSFQSPSINFPCKCQRSSFLVILLTSFRSPFPIRRQRLLLLL